MPALQLPARISVQRYEVGDGAAPARTCQPPGSARLISAWGRRISHAGTICRCAVGVPSANRAPGYQARGSLRKIRKARNAQYAAPEAGGRCRGEEACRDPRTRSAELLRPAVGRGLAAISKGREAYDAASERARAFPSDCTGLTTFSPVEGTKGGDASPATAMICFCQESPSAMRRSKTPLAHA